MAFALREGLSALEGAGVRAPEPRLAGGGTSREPWRRLLADVLARTLLVLPPSVAGVASARGAALLAGIAVGAYRSARETLALAPEPVGTVVPEDDSPYEEAYTRYRELYGRIGTGRSRP
ncbi:hypothetical protein [Rubrobacter marinus]|uniref:hypothetical protein n=1 Tax=Rubrobacter marinus TaxID=2653852 RepID=UPI002B1BCF77|nr:hypothetical protein [Rubrobacter marinus]